MTSSFPPRKRWLRNLASNKSGCCFWGTPRTLSRAHTLAIRQAGIAKHPPKLGCSVRCTLCTLYAVRWWGVPVRTPCTLLYVHCKKWAASAAEGLLLHFMPVWVDTCAQMLVNSVQAASVVTCCYMLLHCYIDTCCHAHDPRLIIPRPPPSPLPAPSPQRFPPHLTSSQSACH